MVSDKDILKFVGIGRLTTCMSVGCFEKMVHYYLVCQCNESKEVWNIPIKEEELSASMIIHFLSATPFKDMLQYELFWRIASIMTRQYYLKVTEISLEKAVDNMKLFSAHFAPLNIPKNCQVNYMYHSDKLIETLKKIEKNHCIRRLTGQFNTLNEVKEVIEYVKAKSKNNEFVYTGYSYSIKEEFPLITCWYIVQLSHVFSKLLTVDRYSSIFNSENLKAINYNTITEFIYA